MPTSKQSRATLSNNEIRGFVLHYFYDRNKNATSGMGKKGSAVKISGVKVRAKGSAWSHAARDTEQPEVPDKPRLG